MYEALLLIDPETPVGLSHLRAEFERSYAADSQAPRLVERHGNVLELVWPDFVIEVGHAGEPHVVVESREIAETHGAAYRHADRVGRCGTRFEVSSDPDPSMDHFNDFLFVVEAAQRIGRVYPFDPQSGTFMDADEGA